MLTSTKWSESYTANCKGNPKSIPIYNWTKHSFQMRRWRWNQMHCSPKGLSFRDWVPIDRDLFDFLGPYSYFKVPIFNVLAKFTLRMSIQSACTQQWVNLICAVLNHNLLMEMVSIFVATASVLHCWQILVFSSSFALNFINRPFGSLFWLLRDPI